MYAAAEANGVMMQEGMWSRFFPATEHARALIEAGAIGDVKVLQGDFGFSGMGQSAEDMAAKRAIHNPSMSCYVAQTAPLAFGAYNKGRRKATCRLLTSSFAMPRFAIPLFATNADRCS